MLLNIWWDGTSIQFSLLLQVLEETKKLYNNTVGPTVEKVASVKDYGINTVTSAKDYGVNTVTSVKDYGVNTASAVKDYSVNTVSAVTSSINFSVFWDCLFFSKFEKDAFLMAFLLYFCICSG